MWKVDRWPVSFASRVGGASLSPAGIGHATNRQQMYSEEVTYPHLCNFLGLWQGSIDLFGEVLIRLHDRSVAGHGGGGRAGMGRGSAFGVDSGMVCKW